MKHCRLCRIEKPLLDFYRHKDYPDGYRSQCKACIQALPKTPEWLAKQVAATLVSRAKEREKFDSYQAIYRAKNKEQIAEVNRKWRFKNPHKVRENLAAWIEKNPQANSVYVARRRARIAGGGGKHTVSEWAERVSYFGNFCAYCLGHESTVGRLTKDHIQPLSAGGSDGIENIVPACSTCNCRKGTRSILKCLLIFQGA